MYRTLITVLNSPFPKKYNIQSTWHVHAASFKPNLSKSLSFSNLCLTDWTTHACMQLGLFCIWLFSIGHWSEIEFCLGATTKSILNEASACACHVHWSLEWKLDFGGARDLFGSEWVAHNNADAITILDVDLLNLARWSQKWTTGLSGTKSKTLKETNVLRCCCCCCCCSNYI